VVHETRCASAASVGRGARPARFGAWQLAVGSVIVVATSLATAELVARVASPDYLVATQGPHVYSDVYGWAARRGVEATIDGQSMSLNQRGFRGRELALPRSPGATRVRVVMLGDSIAFGLHVSDDETFASLLDQRDNGIEVANLAVQGYGPGQELLVLQREGLRLRPDVVVLAFCLANDFADAMLAHSLYDARTPKPRFVLAGDRLVLDDSSLLSSFGRRALQRFRDHSQLLARLAAILPPPRPVPGSHWRERYAEALRDEDSALRLTLALTRRMNRLARERGARFRVALFPDRFTYRVRPALAERFAAALQSEGIPLLDIAARCRSQGLRLNDIALDGTGHLSPRGHALVSQLLEAQILGLRPRAYAPARESARQGDP